MLGHLRERDRRKPENRIGPCRTWQLVADGAPMDTGERNQIFRSFSGTEAQARVALRKLLHELDTNSVSHDENVRLSVWIDRWLAHKVAQKRRRRTIDSYTDLLRLHVTPAVGTQRLSDLTTIKLQRLFDDIHAKGRLTRTRLGEGLSANTVRRVHQALAAALDFAVKMGLLSRNCAKDVELPRAVRKRHRVLSQLEAEKLLSAARDTYLYLFILIGFCIGLRRGEIFGLRWPDIDWNSGIISVERQISEGGFVDAPKTAASTRSILLPRILLEELKRHQISQSATRSLVGSSYSTDGYVFASELGLALSPDGMYTLYRSIFARAGVAYLRPHDLRHSAASLLIASGVPITEVAEILGHSSPAVTLAIYAHAIAKTSSKAADAIQRRFDA